MLAAMELPGESDQLSTRQAQHRTDRTASTIKDPLGSFLLTSGAKEEVVLNEA